MRTDRQTYRLFVFVKTEFCWLFSYAMKRRLHMARSVPYVRRGVALVFHWIWMGIVYVSGESGLAGTYLRNVKAQSLLHAEYTR